MGDLNIFYIKYIWVKNIPQKAKGLSIYQKNVFNQGSQESPARLFISCFKYNYEFYNVPNVRAVLFK